MSWLIKDMPPDDIRTSAFVDLLQGAVPLWMRVQNEIAVEFEHDQSVDTSFCHSESAVEKKEKKLADAALTGGACMRHSMAA